MKYNFKVYLLDHNSSEKDIRRFSIIDQSNECDKKYQLLCQELKNSFPELNGKDYALLWKDNDADLIRISNSRDFELALDESKTSSIIKLWIKPKSPERQEQIPKREETVHSNIVCDGCSGKVVGFRYKCLQCEDYDLCCQCEMSGLHSEHCMIRMPQPVQWSSYHGRRLLDHIRKFFRKTDQNTRRRCHDFSTVNLTPWIETFAQHFNVFNETMTEAQSSNNASASTQASKEEDKTNSKIHIGGLTISKEDIKKILEPFGLDADIDIDCSRSDQGNKDEQKEESKKNECENTGDSKKFPGEGRKLIEKSVSDAASATDEDVSAKKTADEWTFVDRNEACNISSASSTASSSSEISEKQVTPPAPSAPSTQSAPSAPAAPSEASAPIATEASASASSASTATCAPTASKEETPTRQSLYPQLPQDERVYHPNPKIQKALEAMVAMGFSNKGKLLTYLLQAEDGNINKVLDLLQHAEK